jgi:hypothetical protein
MNTLSKGHPVATDDATREDAPDSFAAFLCQTNKGRTERELSEAMQRLVAAVQETGKAGTLTLRIDIKPQANTDGVVTVTDRVTVKAPQLERPNSIFFITKNAGLSRNDPNQRSIFDTEETSSR